MQNVLDSSREEDMSGSLASLRGIGWFALAFWLPLGCHADVRGPTGNSAGTGTGGTAGSPGTTPGPGKPPGPGVSTVDCTKPIPLAKPRIWRLTQNQIRNTLRDRFGFVPPDVETFPAEARLDGFANRSDDLKISPLLADGYFRAAEELGAQAATNPVPFGITCAVASIATGTCLRTFLTTFGEKMWRRPLTDAEVTSFTTLYTTTAAQGAGPAGGIQSVVEAFFLSPNFLHRSELGITQVAGAVTPLTDFELASALSYTLWDTAPDDVLLGLARQGKLRDKTVLVGETKRMLGSVTQASPAMHHFLQQWMYIETLPQANKDVTVYPLGTMEVAADLLEENRLFMNSVLFDAAGDRSLKTLFTANYGFVNSRTAPVYGIQGVTGTGLVRRDLNPSERRGIFSQAGFMWAHADPDGTRLVGRGSYFRGELLCDRVAPPPGGVVAQVRVAPPDATGREKFTIHSIPACAGCHRLFDGLGFAMESYDGIGRFRATDKGKTIDPSGTLPLPSDPSGPGLAFSSFVDLIDKLSNKPDIYNCFATKYLTYASGRNIDSINTCESKNVVDDFAKAGYKIDSLVLSVVSSPNFMDRTN
jgi:hypothetical protein